MGERCSRCGRRRSRSSASCVKKRFAMPLFWERSVIEIKPRTCAPVGRRRTDQRPRDLRPAGGGGLMAQSTVRKTLFSKTSPVYTHAVIAFVDEDGYPVNVATDFKTNPERGTIELDRPASRDQPAEGSEVNVTFSHVQPQPGRRLRPAPLRQHLGHGRDSANGTLGADPERTHGWDEERMSLLRAVRAQRSRRPQLHAEAQRRARRDGQADHVARMVDLPRDPRPVPDRDDRADPVGSRDRSPATVSRRGGLLALAPDRRMRDPPRTERRERCVRCDERCRRGQREPDDVHRWLADDPVRPGEPRAR